MALLRRQAVLFVERELLAQRARRAPCRCGDRSAWRASSGVGWPHSYNAAACLKPAGAPSRRCYCSRTITLSAAPLASITVSRRKPGPSGSTNSVRRLAARRRRQAVDQHGQRLDAAGDLERQRIGLAAPAVASSMRAPLGGNRMRSAGAPPSPGKAVRAEVLQRRRQLARWRRTATPFGACGSATGGWPVRAKASNRIGAAAVRPTRPGTGAPSGRPTQTPMVRRPSKPTAQASR